MSFETSTRYFSPDGRLYQVEYAQHASDQGGLACLSIYNDKIYVFYDNKQINNLQILDDRIVYLRNNMFLLFSGVKPDCYNLIDSCASKILSHKLECDEDLTVEELTGFISEFKQWYTVSRTFRPLGLKTVVFGFENGKPKIYVVEADGNFAEYEKCAVGSKADKIYDKFEDVDEFSALKALITVTPKDAKNIKGFKIENNNNIKEIDTKIIHDKINNFE